MHRPPHLDADIQDFTTLNDLKEYIKEIDEKTSSSPSTRHYCHYKTLYSADEKYLRTIHGLLKMSLQSQTIFGSLEEDGHSLDREEVRTSTHPSLSCHPCDRGRSPISFKILLCI